MEKTTKEQRYEERCKHAVECSKRLVQENRDLNRRIGELEGENDVLRADYADLRDQCRRLHQENDEFADALAEMTAERDRLLAAQFECDIYVEKECDCDEFGFEEYPVFDEVELLEMELESASDKIERLKNCVAQLEEELETQCMGNKIVLELNEEYRAKINELENDLSVQKGIVHVQDDCIDNMMDIFKVVESVCDKWERVSKMMIKNDHHAIAGIALQKMAADIRAAL